MDNTQTQEGAYNLKEISGLLDKFKEDALTKFEAGRKEHKEDLSKLDYDMEIYKEITDLLLYFLLKKKYGKTKPANHN